MGKSHGEDVSHPLTGSRENVATIVPFTPVWVGGSVQQVSEQQAAGGSSVGKGCSCQVGLTHGDLASVRGPAEIKNQGPQGTRPRRQKQRGGHDSGHSQLWPGNTWGQQMLADGLVGHLNSPPFPGRREEGSCHHKVVPMAEPPT